MIERTVSSYPYMGENAHFKNGHAHLKNASVSDKCRRLLEALVDSVSVRFQIARVEKMPLNIRIQWNAGNACVSECVLKTLACRGLRVGPSKLLSLLPHYPFPHRFVRKGFSWPDCRCSYVLVLEPHVDQAKSWGIMQNHALVSV